MKAEIISVGSSLLKGLVENKNAAFIARELTSVGINVTQAVMIDNSKEKLLETIEKAEQQSDVLVFTGGLGPDDDDIVKTTLSEHLDKPLVLDDDTQN